MLLLQYIPHFNTLYCVYFTQSYVVKGLVKTDNNESETYCGPSRVHALPKGLQAEGGHY